MDVDLAGQSAIVTGAAQGIGRSIAARLSGAGASVMIADVQADKAADTAAALAGDGRVEAVACDVTSIDDADRVAEATLAEFGSIDILVNNAGIGSAGSFEDIEPDRWQAVIDVNLTGVYHCARAVVPAMIDAGYGRIVNISSMAGRNISYHGAANYTASKWGVIGLTKHMAWDLGGHGITVNAVCPGSTLTALTRDGTTAADRAATADKIPLGRWAEPEDQADAVAFLVSDAGAYLTGTVLEVDGGKQLGVRHDA